MAEVCSIPYNYEGRLDSIRMESCGGRDQVVVQAYSAGWRSYEEPMPVVLLRLIGRAPCAFIDIGANTGFYTLIAAKAGAVALHAFEPVPFIAKILIANIQHNFSDVHKGIQVYNYALSNQKGETCLYLPLQNHGLIETSASLNPQFRHEHSDVFKVNVTTLDDHLELEPIARELSLVIKIDVESFEPQVLEGAAKTICKRRPAILLEILPGADLDFYQKWIVKYNYKHYQLLPPNNIIAAKNIETSLSCRDHLFLPEEYEMPF